MYQDRLDKQEVSSILDYRSFVTISQRLVMEDAKHNPVVSKISLAASFGFLDSVLYLDKMNCAFI